MDDLIDRQKAIDALDVLCQEHRYRIPGKRETYSQYNEAWQDALDRAECALGRLPSAERQGKWIKMAEGWGSLWKCDQCGEVTVETVMGKPRANYCPNCGARMEASE